MGNTGMLGYFVIDSLYITRKMNLLKYVVNKTIFSEMQQLKEVLEVFDEDYKQGNMTRLASDFKSALKEYGDGIVFAFI